MNRMPSTHAGRISTARCCSCSKSRTCGCNRSITCSTRRRSRRFEEGNFQTFLGDYLQRNPSVWAVNLVEFDEQGNPVSRSSKPGCLQPDQMHRDDFDDFLLPEISSCRIDDKALLEVAGPVSNGESAVVLLVSMDYFDFLAEFSTLTGRRLQRVADNEQGVQYEEFGSSDPAMRITLPVGNSEGVFGELHLARQPLSFAGLFAGQALIVVIVLAAGAALLLWLLHTYLLRPLLTLAEEMRIVASSQQESGALRGRVLGPGLQAMYDYFNAMQKMARRDPVTGLNNRVIFEDRLSQAMREGKRSGRRYALVLIEFRGLEEFALQRGQYIVDALLRQVGKLLEESLRESDHVARFERNLFALLLEVQQREQLNALVEKIYLAVVRRYRVYGREFDLRAYFGVVLYPDHALDADNLYQGASEALIRAEHSDWPVAYFLDEKHSGDTSGFTMIQALRRAIERDELKLVYQPVVDLDTYATVYLEALLRWRDPERHIYPIEDTIRIAEQNQMIKPLTNWIIEAVCRFIAESDIDGIAVGINLSMIDLHDRDLPQRIGNYLERHDVRPQQIVVEITEGQIMQDPDEVVEVLSRLGAMGLSLSIDDFGTGQASLTYLKELPVEKLKIDQSFVRDIATNPDDQLIVRATIELAHTLDLEVVAEGVETLAICELLTELKCDHVQGYYVSSRRRSKPDLVRRSRSPTGSQLRSDPTWYAAGVDHAASGRTGRPAKPESRSYPGALSFRPGRVPTGR